MTVYGSGDPGDFAKSIEAAGTAESRSMIITWNGLEPPVLNPTSGEAPRWRLECALKTEWDALRHALPRALEDAVLNWLDDGDTTSVEIAIAAGAANASPFNSRRATGHGDILTGLSEVRAAALFRYMAGESTASLIITGKAANSKAVPADFEISASDELETIIALGRLYNRSIKPGHPLEWVRLLADRGDDGDLPVLTEIQYPGMADALLTAARAFSRRMLPPSVEQPSGERPAGTSRDRHPDNPVPASGNASPMRQIIGAPGLSGQVRGRSMSSELPRERGIFVCGELTIEDLPLARNATAIVEQYGCGFGPGALLARQLGIPHVYRALESDCIPAGADLQVDGALGIVTLLSQS
jgi:phosphohistidine swiveling domain-containing protein